MAHFAKLDENNVVLEVIVVNNSDILDANGVEQEEIGVTFLTQWSGGHQHWKQASYNKNFRKNYPGRGYTYDAQRDAFLPPRAFLSWPLNENTCQWEPPIPLPDEENYYDWDEATLSWIKVQR